ncbi:MAG TPA: RagB/SusD family nutrient uptake outer membrane protein [Flavobacterium sp.]|nr:RagB/SusD family nutrient uptake outer membrane protein [Flavobacterium sp.]
MKHINKLLLLLFTSVFFVSCDDAINIEQSGDLTPDKFFTSVDDVRDALYGCYISIPAENAIEFTSIFTDEIAIGLTNGGQGIDLYSGILNANDGYAASIWYGNYRLINLTNRLIEGAATIEIETAAEQDQMDHILAHAHALRGLAYLQLMTYFCTDMTDDSALGVMSITEVTGLYYTAPRASAGEIFQIINDDFDFAQANFGDAGVANDTSTSGESFLSEAAVLAFKARMAAYRGKYTEALALSTDAITASGKAITLPSAYGDIWKDTQVGEVMFKIVRTAASVSDANFYQVWSSANATISGSPFLEVNRALFNLVNSPNDVRRFVIAHPSSLINPDYANVPLGVYKNTDVLPVGKYATSKGVNLLGDIKSMRLSELYFIRAEAKVTDGDLVGAAQDIFAVRGKRVTGSAMPVYNSPQEAWEDILMERRAELAFEGHRYIDLKRLAGKANAGVDRDPQDCSAQGFPCTMPINYKFTMPIPTRELNANPLIRSQQNPNY